MGSGWTTTAPWKLIAGSGQTLAVTTSSAGFTNVMGPETRAFAISLEPTVTATGATVRVTAAALAATTAEGIFIKTTDGPLVVGCTPGEKVTVIGLAAATAHLVELTH